MKTAARKPAKAHSSTVTRSGGFFKASGSPGFFAPVMRKASTSPAIQASRLSVSKPGDPLEKAADRTADAVMRMSTEHVQRATSPDQVQRTASPEQVQRFGGGTSTVAADAKSEIQQAATGGQGLSSDLRSFMEPRLGADLSGVRVHADEGAHSLSNHLSARAFTFGNHVFFGRGQYQPGTDAGRHLIAHELTHTIQQGATVQRATDTAVQAATAPELQRTEQPVVQRSTQPDVQRSPAPEVARAPHVATSGSAPAVQRMGVVEQKALDHFADAANNIMGFRMLTLVLGFNPINQRRADRTPANILRALIEVVPGGALITRVLDTHGVINKAAAWVEQKVNALGDIGGQIVQAVKDFVGGLSWTDVGSLSGLWDRAKRLVTDPIARLISFGTGVVGELLSLVREAILKPLAALAEGTRGYDLLKAILGKDPITGEPFPPTADNLIGGFMKLIDQEEVWLNIKRGNAVPRAWAWFQGALAGLKQFAATIPARITGTLASLTFPDVVSVLGAFNKVKAAFVDVAGQFFSWAGKQVITLLEILVSVVAPGVMPYIAKAKAAFQTIVKDPVRFVGHLVRAGRLGFEKFADNILEHLKSALIKWLVGPLAQAGVYIPKSFDLLEIVKLVLSVLGLTWQNIRTKLVKIIPEPVLAGLEKTAKVLVTLVTDGPAAAWEEIKNELNELKDQLIGQVTSMIQMEVVKAAVTKLVMMLNPAGAVVQAITAIWKTVTFFIEKAQQIGAVVASFIDSIAAIAAGQVENAAKRVEKTMADTLVVVIGFLANFAGLGGIPTKLVGIVKKIRAPIDKGLDKIVAWLGKMLQSLVGKAKDAAKKLLQWWKKKVPITGADEPHTLTFEGEGESAKLVIMSAPQKPSKFLLGEATKVNKHNQEDVKKDISDTKSTEERIHGIQNELARFDGTGKESAKTAPTGKEREKAGRLSGELNLALIGLAKIVSGTLLKLGLNIDEEIPEFKIGRAGDFTGKLEIAKAYDVWREGLPDDHPERLRDRVKRDEAGRPTLGVTPDTARRHIVSSADMANHYGEVLSKKKVSHGKLLVEQSGSVESARVAVMADNKGPKVKFRPDAVVVAAKERYKRFFSYIPNLFLGDRTENRAIGKRLDPGKPGMVDEAFRDHVAMIKRQWALDGSFRPTPARRE